MLDAHKKSPAGQRLSGAFWSVADATGAISNGVLITRTSKQTKKPHNNPNLTQ